MSNESSKFEWVSPEVEKTYKMFVRAYSQSIKRQFPFVIHISVSPSNFNNIFIYKNWMKSVKVYICTDFGDPSFDSRTSPEEFGSEVVHRFNDVVSLLLNIPELKEKYVAGEFELNNQEICDKLSQEKETLKEEKQNGIPITVRRRLLQISTLIHYLLDKYYQPEKICDLYGSYDEFIQVISEAVAERMYYSYFSHLDEMGDEWTEIYHGIMGYIDDHWGQRLEKYFNENCDKQSLNEDISDRIRDRFYNFLQDNSLMTAISFFGHDNVNKILKEVEISKKDKIKFIKDIIDEYGPLTIFDLNEDPIFYNKNDTEYREIFYFGKQRVTVKVWDIESWNDEGEFDVSYEALDDSSIYDIFEMLYEYHEEENKKTLNESVEKKKIPQTAQQLIKQLPEELKKILFNQWNAKQNPDWHPEGNTLKHIIVVIKRAFHHYPEDPNMIMAALFHDLGKMDTYAINPKTNQPTAYGHENKSTDYVEKFRDWIESFEGTDADEVKYLVKNHMLVKPRTWDSMKDKKKESIKTNKAFDKLMGFTEKLDGGGMSIQKIN